MAAKLSKADGDTSVRELRAAGAFAHDLIGRSAAAVGLIDRPVALSAAEGAALAAASVPLSRAL